MNALRPLFLASLLAISPAALAEGDPRDPMESFNRGVHSFNEGFDRAVLKPVAEGYKAVLPSFARTGVRNFFSNVNDVSVLANDILQFKLQQGVSDLMRLSVNTVFGLGGVLDIASEAGLRKHDEDFGQTLGRWGMGSGAYLVLPFFGSSSLRDAVGLGVDSVYSDLVYDIDQWEPRTFAVALRAVSVRTDLLEAKQAVDAAAWVTTTNSCATSIWIAASSRSTTAIRRNPRTDEQGLRTRRRAGG
jgi:phospholipid-binding lipoprotein MlaA